MALSRSSLVPTRVPICENQSPKHLRSNLGSSTCIARLKRLASRSISLLGEAGGVSAFGEELLERAVLTGAKVLVCSLNL